MPFADMNINIELEFPEYYPNYPHNLNVHYNSELLSSFHRDFTKEFCNIGPYMDSAVHSDALQWTAFVYPNASEHKLINLGKLFTVLFFIDDMIENTFGDVGRSAEKAKPFAEMCCKLIDNIADIRKIPINEIETWKPFMFALYSTQYAIYLESKPSLWKYFTNKMKKFFNSFIDECKIDDQSYIVDESEILEFRVDNSGGLPTICLISYVYGIELTDNELNSESLQTVFNYAVKTMQLCNDLYSFRKEIKECNGMTEKSKNTIAVLIRTQSLTLQEAFDKQVMIIKSMDEKYSKAKQLLFETLPSKKVRRLCGHIDLLIGGNWIFHLGAKRYNGLNFKGCIPSNGKFIYSPNETMC